MGKLFLFNPDNDLALASGSDHFDAPQSAKVFAKDFACLPLWYAAAGDCVRVGQEHAGWLAEVRSRFPQAQAVAAGCDADVDGVVPWGWNKALRKTLEKEGFQQLPSAEEIDAVRELSHRRCSIEAMKELYLLNDGRLRIVPPAVLLAKDEIDAYEKEHPYCIFKAPWSGSGKGICRSLGGLSENLRNRVVRMAEKQGCVLAEPLYQVVQDFAMEFSCRNGRSEFVGYSWFFTNGNGAYQGNLLASDGQIEERLSRWIAREHLAQIREGLLSFLDRRVAPNYTGFCGVDMFVLSTGEGFAVHPCVEINLRMTMGLVARMFCDRFVEAGRAGSYHIDFFKLPEELVKDDELRRKEMPLVVQKGKIQSGYVSLTPIEAGTHYRARVEIT